MSHFIDRRLNPKGKSLGNRQRFLRRARGQIRDAVARSLRDRSVKDVDRSGRVTIPARSTAEPRYRLDPASGSRRHVHPGNKSFETGDRLRKPPQGGGRGGRDPAEDGDGEDAFSFTLTRDEFLDVFFEDLELPNLVKTSLLDMETVRYRRAGVTVSGAPTNMNLVRTMRNAHGRRLALGRPTSEEVAALKERLFALESVSQPTDDQRTALSAVIAELEAL